MEITAEQRERAERNRLAAFAKRKAAFLQQEEENTLKLVKCRKLSNPEKFIARIEICSPDSFTVSPFPLDGFSFPGQQRCFHQLTNYLSTALMSHYTQNTGGGTACVYKLSDYQTILRSLRNCEGIQCEEIPWITFNVVERFSYSFAIGKWMPCRPEHLPDEKVDQLIAELPKPLLSSLLPFQLDGVRYGLRRGGRCLIADEMGLGKTLQAIAMAACFMKEGSILVVCPAILRYSWAEELERWFPFCLPTDIHLVLCSKDNPSRLPKRPKVVVISYTMLRILKKSMLEQEWVTLIVDESHHLRSTKQASEKDELTAVLDVAMNVKHLILLSGTPSLSRLRSKFKCMLTYTFVLGDDRPFDIFHQINILWPGLLGQTKFEFAKTYCAVKYVWGSQGKLFQDFSKGIRLEELNVLLKQSVMIRRLKEHVLPQLPPKRRQIINLVLKGSDINLAMETLGLRSDDAFADSDDENLSLHVSEEDKDSDMNKKLSKKLSALGIAKLPGFFEWLSIHPIMSKVDEEEGSEESCGSHKMIIFCYHHKVLDGVQVFLCEKEIQFVRIDCNVVGSDRQAAIHSFQFSKEVKIALIGIRSGGSGLNLTAADTVVFLEMPLRPADMQQAEDRAHRHGQKKLVNIYIFSAKDTVDESHWQRLNRSLLQVSSTVNGKHGALQEIEVESVSYLETTCRISEESKILLDDEPVTKLMEVQDSSSDFDSKVNYGEQNKSNAISSWRRELHFEGKIATLRNDEYGAEFDSGSCSQSMKESNDGVSQKMNVGISPHSTLNNDEKKTDFKSRARCSNQEALRFEVSRYTGRIHLYSCLPGADLRPKPLFINIRQEEFDAENVKEIQSYKDALIDFIAQWKELRPIEKRKLIGKPLQLPLSYELCYLNESLNHDNRGVINGGSKRRKTPKDEISCPLPPNATWKKVNLYGGRGEKEKLYKQGWSDINEPLCKLCQSPCKHHNAKVPQFFEDLFCGLDCFEEYRSRTSNRFLREELFKIEKGVCTNCGLDCHKLVEHLRPLSPALRQAYIKKNASNIAERKKLLEKLVNDPTEGNAWHADHIVPVYKGGGECRLDNIRTLCVACHANVTNMQCVERRIARKKAKKQLKDIMNGFKNVNKSGKNDNIALQDKKEEDDDLLIDIPGSAYSEVNCNGETTKDGERKEQEQQLLDNAPREDNVSSEALKLIQNGQRLKELENNPPYSDDPTRSAACIDSSNEASQVNSKTVNEKKSVEIAHCESVDESNENEKSNMAKHSRKSMFSEFKTLLGEDF